MKRLAWLPVLVLLAFVSHVGAEDAPPSPVAYPEDVARYSAEDLDGIVGPIALYPDIVLASLLPASTQPLDVVQVARWLARQEGEIPAIPEGVTWDANVAALLQFPDVLTWMSLHLDWLQELGYAVVVQLEDVLAAVQRVRTQAEQAGNLQSSEKWVISFDNDSIYIQPAKPTVVSVPKYDAYGAQRPGYVWPHWADIPAGELGAWSWNTIWWDGPWGRGSMRVHGSAAWNFDATGRMGVLPDDGQPWQPRAVPGSGQAQDRPARADDRAPQPEAPAFEKPRKGGRARKDGMKPEAVELLRPLPGRVGGTRPVKPRPLPEDDAQTRELPGRVGGTRPVASGTSDDADVFRPTPGRSGGSRPVGAPRNAFSNAVRSGAYAREISERGRESRDRDEDDR